MTSLAISISVDSRGPSALYIITDSRITWKPHPGRWDCGGKTFASSTSPDIFGYCGDAYFPPLIFQQLLQQIHAGLLFGTSLNAEARHTAVVSAFRGALQRQERAPVVPFSLFHGARDGEFMASDFRVWETHYLADRTWDDKELGIVSDCSYLVHIDGSGGPAIKQTGVRMKNIPAQGTSRAAIATFCQTLREGKDSKSAPPPQLVGIWRKGAARHFGFLWNGKRYLAGLEVSGDVDWGVVQWFNDRFERCDGEAARKLLTAQRHPKSDFRTQ